MLRRHQRGDQGDGRAERNGSSVRAGKNIPARLDAELAQWVTLVGEVDDLGLLGVGALDGDEIKRVYVHPRAFGHGVGHALIKALEAEALRRGVMEIRLESSPSAVLFYECLGYTRGDVDRLVVDDATFDHVRMRKYIAPSI